MQPNELWLSPEVFDWEVLAGGASPVNPSIAAEHKGMWRHCVRLGGHLEDEHRRTDLIINLKKVVDRQADVLSATYGLSGPATWFTPQKMRSIEKLAKVGLVRPYLLHKLRALRNRVEHEYDAPTEEDCQMYLDVVWYFLRSTDPYLVWTTNSFTLVPSVYDSLNPMPGADCLEIWGRVDPRRPGKWRLAVGEGESFVSGTVVPDWIELKLELTDDLGVPKYVTPSSQEYELKFAAHYFMAR